MSKVTDIKGTLRPNCWPLGKLHSTLCLCHHGQSRRAALICTTSVSLAREVSSSLPTQGLHLTKYRWPSPSWGRQELWSPWDSAPKPGFIAREWDGSGACGDLLSHSYLYEPNLHSSYCGLNLKCHSLLLRFTCDHFLKLESKRRARRVCRWGPEIGLNYAEGSESWGCWAAFCAFLQFITQCVSDQLRQSGLTIAI